MSDNALMTIRRTLAILALLIAPLVACANTDQTAPATTAATSTTATSTTPGTTLPTTTVEPESIVETTPEPIVEPYIVSCQLGLGPIETYWSDGSVTGYSDYCQAQHDQISRAEVEANTPTCDGTVCRYPSGATAPDNRSTTTVRTPSPWVQGQIDWQNCIDAGNSQEYCRATVN